METLAKHNLWVEQIQFAKFKTFGKENAHHSSKHATKAPHVQRIIIILQINQQFRTFKVSGKVDINFINR